MKYNNKKVIGDAGEHYFTYWIINNFKFPCRLLDKDLGIDAKIEILNNEQETTGEFIFVQIKSSNSNKIKHTIKLKHFMYWESISLPVVLVGLNLENNNIYWLHINEKEILKKYKLRALKSKNEHILIDISIEGKLLTLDDKELFKILRFKNLIPEVEAQIEELESASTSIINTFHEVKEDDRNSFDEVICRNNLYLYDFLSSYICDINILYKNNESLNEIKKIYPTIINHLKYNQIELNDILNNVNKAFEFIDITYDYMNEFIKNYEYVYEFKDVLYSLEGITITDEYALKLYQLIQFRS